MAATLPDLNTATAANIFSQPFPAVKKTHRQLHDLLDEKNAKLRTQVGGSYRQLLGTAETIVRMREEIGEVEYKMEGLVDGCGTNVLGRRVGGLSKMGKERERRDVHGDRDGRLKWAARVKALQGCSIVVWRLLRNKEGSGKRLLITAKVLVLARLLVKSLSEEEKGQEWQDEAALSELKRKLASLRKRLLRAVDRRLENKDTERDELIQALCAHSMATSSGAKEGLQHFLSVRGVAIVSTVEIARDDEGRGVVDHEAVAGALALLAKTLVDVQSMVPRRFSDALLELKADHLLDDKSFAELEGLRLDICQKWFGDEITYFTPYIRHDDFDGSIAVETLTAWAERAMRALLQGLDKYVIVVHDFKDVIKLRTTLLKTWVAEAGKVKRFDSSEMVHGLREVLNKRLIDLLEQRVGKLHIVGGQVAHGIQLVEADVDSHQSLWDEDIVHMELKESVGRFKDQIIEAVHGRGYMVSRTLKAYQEWKKLVDEMAVDIQQLQNQRWNDDLDSLEDEETLEERQKSLSHDDPAMLQNKLKESLKSALALLEHEIGKLIPIDVDNGVEGKVTALILRVLRDIRTDLPKQADVSSFGLMLVPQLHELLAEDVVESVLHAYANSLRKRKRVAGRALWEGEPELPIYPSSRIFKLLYSTCDFVGNAGGDLWSHVAVAVLKTHLSKRLAEEIKNSLPTAESEKKPDTDEKKEASATEEPGTSGEELLPEDAENADETSEKDEDAAKKDQEKQKKQAEDILIQTIFDVMVLKLCLTVPGNPDSVGYLVELEKVLKAKAEVADLDESRLARAAQEYHKRTSLLLGPLA